MNAGALAPERYPLEFLGLVRELGRATVSDTADQSLGTSAPGLSSINGQLQSDRVSPEIYEKLEATSSLSFNVLSSRSPRELLADSEDEAHFRRNCRDLVVACLEEALVVGLDFSEVPRAPMSRPQSKLEEELRMLIERWNSGDRQTQITREHIIELLGAVRGVPEDYLRWRAAWDGGPGEPSLMHLLSQGESAEIEWKATLRTELDTGAKNRERTRDVAKAVCGFLNADGGHLLIGVKDDGSIFGIEQDLSTLKRRDRDGFEQALRGLIAERIDESANRLVRVSFSTVEMRTVCICTVTPAARPVFMGPDFFVRAGNTTRPLTPRDTYVYLEAHRPDALRTAVV